MGGHEHGDDAGHLGGAARNRQHVYDFFPLLLAVACAEPSPPEFLLLPIGGEGFLVGLELGQCE